MATVEDKYVYTTAEESVIAKDWAAGSKIPLETSEFVVRRPQATGGYVGEYTTVKYPPALWKIIDEPIVNALDHLVRCLGTDTPVTSIKVSIDRAGKVEIYNTGKGVEVAIHKVATEKLKRDTWVPTFIFGILHQGSNCSYSEGSIIGGVNGLGAKLSNCFSTEFTVETSDSHKYFSQTWTDHMKNVSNPTIIDLKTKHKLPAIKVRQHTKLSFTPDYTGIFDYPEFTEDLYQLLTDLIRTRVMFAAAYARYTVATVKPVQKFDIMFNNEKITIKSIADIASIIYPGKQIIKSVIKPTSARKHFSHAWEVCVVVTPSESLQVSNVNGIVVRGGTHHKHIMTDLTNGVKDKVSKIIKSENLKFSASLVSNNVVLFMNTKIPTPSWSGQRKDVLGTDIRNLAGYKLDTKLINPIAETLSEVILASILEKIPSASGKKKTKKTDYEKYKGATNAGTRKSSQCVLIPIEGDSAMTQVCIGISNNLGWDNYGAISLGGVIMNARRECTVTPTDLGQYVKKSTKLTNNIFMKVLGEVTGLNTAYRYDPKLPTYKKEMSELHYGAIAACVDQDLDGKGNILGLLLSTFELFWPTLLVAGFIKWFRTPIIRAYPKRGGTIKAFFSIEEYNEWESGRDTSQFLAKYYKGIGTHSRDETIHMFKSFEENLITYYTDDRSRELFEIYFGSEPDKRKLELAKPTQIPSREKTAQQGLTKRISCSDHLEYETNMYQKDNLERKLDHVIDGQNQAGRKILDGILKGLKGNKEIKVAQLAGFISEHENYHHGEASLCSSITGKGFVATGGKQLPFLVPLSMFGSRMGGGSDSAAPRYIFAKLNKNIVNLIFPETDYWILPFNFDEGKRGEPKYFVPIIPMVLTESTELPAHGWKLKTWARDVFKIIDNVQRQIRLDDNVELLKLPPAVYKGATYEWTGDIKTIRGDTYSFGKYTAFKNIITITELPLRVWTNKYIQKLNKKASADDRIIGDVHDKSDDIHINIEITLKSGAWDLLDEMGDSVWTDGVEEYFFLRDRMDSHINLMGVDNSVLMFEDYESVMYEWFPIRKEYYNKRIIREQLLMKLRITMLENTIRYITESTELDLAKKPKSTMVTILKKANYDTLYVEKITNPKYTPVDTLEDIILRGPKSNYDYLLGLSDLKKSEESLATLRGKLQEVTDALRELTDRANKGRFPGATIWDEELTELRKQIDQGQKTFWKYEDADRFKFE